MEGEASAIEIPERPVKAERFGNAFCGSCSAKTVWGQKGKLRLF